MILRVRSIMLNLPGKLTYIMLFFVFFLRPAEPAAQIYYGTGGNIPDDSTDVYFGLNVTGITPAVADTNFGLETVCINISHTNTSNLLISLVSPDGTEFALSAFNGKFGVNYTNTCFNNEAAIFIEQGQSPYTGTFKPEGSMSSVNNGQNPNGNWKLHILDARPYSHSGVVISWTLTFGNNPASPFPFTGTVLPLLIINSNGQLINDEPKIMADMRIIFKGNGQINTASDSANVYSGKAGIEQRGTSSSNMPKKSFNFETRNADSTDRNVSLLGMPSESDWLLLANYSDKTQLRNYYAYHLFGKLGRWAPRMRFCELLLNGEYQGIYLLGEKIKRDNDRVNISSLSSGITTLPELSGGYIFKLDWVKPRDVVWKSEFNAINSIKKLNYILEYPKPANVIHEQLDYIKSYVDSFEYVMTQPYYNNSVTGYTRFIDRSSLVDIFLLSEFTKNVDAYRLSSFFSKDRNGKIIAGPPWDYDLAMGNVNYWDCENTAGWSLKTQMVNTDQCPFWWDILFMDTLFQNRVRCRWEELRNTVFNPQIIATEIDSVAASLGSSINMNFVKWPVLGVYVWPNPDPIPADYAGEIQNLKNWISSRFAWLEINLPGICYQGTDEIMADNNLQPFIAPNPVENTFRIFGFHKTGESTVSILTLCGKVFYETTWDGTSPLKIPDNTANGLYLLKIRNGNTIKVLKLAVG